MSHVRNSTSQAGGGGGGGGDKDAATSPEDRQKAMQVEQMQVYKQCQFILKPRPVELLQLSAGEATRPERCVNVDSFLITLTETRRLPRLSSDLPQKTFKRRRSLIAWAFWRGSSSQLNELSLSGAARGCLFGQPLSSVCVEDALPKPVMVQ